MENSTTLDRHLANKLAEANQNIETLKWRFNQLKVLKESESGNWA